MRIRGFDDSIVRCPTDLNRAAKLHIYRDSCNIALAKSSAKWQKNAFFSYMVQVIRLILCTFALVGWPLAPFPFNR